MTGEKNNYTPEAPAGKQDEDILAGLARQQVRQVPADKSAIDDTPYHPEGDLSAGAADTNSEHRDYTSEDEPTRLTGAKTVVTGKPDAVDQKSHTKGDADPMIPSSPASRPMVRIGIHAPPKRYRPVLRLLLEIIAVAGLTGIAIILHYLTR